ncbi:hypothetical protein BBJ29_001198 [Phytophthora kernoviae]|uniref:Cas12f1-like TNB domain-containing protein n=1 Tax=Phytophthora kernoviae TaxID=325452 RepID=A0A3R7KF23_9STRA|nr:hypothetical protein BBJ29_001198 [Phytophthora kernoviae]
MFATNRAVYNILVARSKEDCATRLVVRGKTHKLQKMTLKELGRKYRPASQTGEMGPYFRNKKALERYLQVNDKVRDGRTLSVKDAYAVLKRRFEAIDAMKSKLASLENKSKTKGTARSHFKFKTLVKYEMNRVGGRVVECEEEYTSKACSSCGGIKNDMGGSSMCKYSFCHTVHDRDVNVAKNFFHKNIQMLC